MDALVGGTSSDSAEAYEDVYVSAVVDVALKLQPPPDDQTNPPSRDEMVGRIVESLRSLKSWRGGEEGRRPLELRAIEVIKEW